MEIILATQNQAKVKEFLTLLDLSFINLTSIQQYGLDLDVKEDGESYKENALIKARYAHSKLGGNILADDSGLSVDALDGYPGIYSSRFAGVSATYEDKIQKLWELLRDYPKESWTAAFHSALAFISEDGEEHVFEAKCKGLIIAEFRGENGFGYDPVFYMKQYNMTTAEMDIDFKNKISHRGKASQKLRSYLLNKKTY